MEIHRLHGNSWKCMEMHGTAWTCMDMRGNAGKCKEMHGNAWKCMEMHGNAWTCMEMHGNAWKRMETHGNAPKQRTRIEDASQATYQTSASSARCGSRPPPCSRTRWLSAQSWAAALPSAWLGRPPAWARPSSRRLPPSSASPELSVIAFCVTHQCLSKCRPRRAKPPLVERRTSTSMARSLSPRRPRSALL